MCGILATARPPWERTRGDVTVTAAIGRSVRGNATFGDVVTVRRDTA